MANKPRSKTLSCGLLLATAISSGNATGDDWNCAMQPAGDWQCLSPGYQLPQKVDRSAPAADIAEISDSQLVNEERGNVTIPPADMAEMDDSLPVNEDRSAIAIPAADTAEISDDPPVNEQSAIATPATDMAETDDTLAVNEEVTPVAEEAEPAEDTIPSGIAENTEDILPVSLPEIDQNLDWSACNTLLETAPLASFRSDGLTQVEADAATLNQLQQEVMFSGNVQMQFEDKLLFAEDLSFNKTDDFLHSEGKVLLTSPVLRISGDQLQYKLGSDTGTLSNVDYRLFNPAARGSADNAEFIGDGLSSYENISFTTCPPGNSDFFLSAERLDIDRNNATATFSSAKLRFFGVPVFYLPKLSIPLDNQRQSGFLLPAVGYRSRTGVDIATPYYFNLAPNYDATLTPRYMSKRGVAIGGEFRYLTGPHKGEFRAEVLPDDREFEEGGARGALYIDQKSTFAPNFTGRIVASAVSDNQYLTDLGDSLAVSGTRFLPRMGRLDYHTRNWDFFGRLQYFQTIDDQITEAEKPYARLPQLRADMINASGPGGLDYSFLSEYVYFYRSSGMTAHRAYMNPGISLPVRRDWGYIEPRLTGNYTVYGLNDQPDDQDASINRATGSLSLDSGLFFDRQTSLFGDQVTQTLEPRLFYLYVPDVDQDDIPIFDTGLLDFNFDNLFRLNRFNGIDRIGDANQLTLALSSRLLAADSGAEILKASIGQIYYFEDRSVILPDEPLLDDSSSPVYAQIGGKLPGYWRYRAGAEIDPHTSSAKIQQGLAQLIYRADDQHFFSASYRQRRDIVEQTDLSVLWPLGNDISVIGRWNYSLLKNKTLESVAGIEYGHCCWRVRAVVRQYLDDDSDEQNLTFLIQLELNGLGVLGNDIQSYLEDNLYGYRNDDY